MDTLSDLMSCCRGLDTDKVTERKKNAEKLKQLLGKNSVIKTLDRNTDERATGRNNNRSVTWDDVFKAVVVYVRVETATLQKAKESQSLTTQQNREKKKQEVSSFFKFIVRTADKRGARLRQQNVVSHVLEVLRDDYMCAAYGQDYSSIILKNVLPVRKYWVDIKPDTWKDLLHQFCSMFLDGDCRIDRVILARLISCVLSGASRQSDLHPKKILMFFTEVFKNIRQEKGSHVLEHLLTALNVFVRKIAASSRVQVCKLGETIFINLLYLWNNRPSDSMKDEIVEFMQIQLQAHHPGGVKSSNTGEFTVDRQLWMSHLRKLYDLMYTDLQQMGGRNRFTSGTRESVLKPAYVDLAADVCNQLFSETSDTIEVTQLTMLGEGEVSTPTKKRRLESGWTVVRDTLLSTGSTHQVIPWLQLVTRLVEKYAANLPESELLPLLRCLHTLLNDCKKSDILRHILHCLVTLASSYSQLQHITMATRESTRDLWHAIWSSTLRSISSHQAEAEGYQQQGFLLLAAIIRQKFVKPERDMWNLFLPNVSSPSQSSLQFLLVCLQLHDLPENHQPSILGSQSTGPEGSYSLRKHLLNWILPKRDIADLSKPPAKIDPDLTSKVLACLVVRNPSLIVSTTPNTDHLTQLERIYLETTFDYELRIEKLLRNSEEKELEMDVSVICSMLQVLNETFQDQVACYQNVTEPQMSVLERVISCCAVLVKCICNLVDIRVTSPAKITETGLVICLKNLLRKMSSLLGDLVKKEGCARLSPLILSLQTLFLFGCETKTHKQGTFVIAELLRKDLPGNFFDILLDIAFKKMSRSNSNANNSNTTLSDRRDSARFAGRTSGRASRDDFDLDFDDNLQLSPGANEEDAMDLDEVDDIGESQDSEDVQQSDVCASMVDVDLLSENHRLRLEVVRLLCQCCSFQTEVAPAELPYRAELSSTCLKLKLEAMLDENLFDPEKAVDILVLETVVRSFTRQSSKMSDRDLENMVDAIRQVSRVQRREQEVSCLSLQLMSLIIPYLSDPDDLPSKVKQDCREITLRLLSAFIKVRDDGQYSAPVRLAIAQCMQAFIQCDPREQWCHLMRRDSDDSDSIVKEFPGCMMDGCHVTRSYMTQAIQSLFAIKSDKGFHAMPAVCQHKAFDQLYENCNELMEINMSKMSSEKIQDETTSRTSTILSVLATIACTSPLNEKKAMFALCQLIRERDIPTDKVIKVLSRLSGLLGYRDVESYLCGHLPYLLSQWLQLDYSLHEFPYRLFDKKTVTEFYMAYKDIVVPALFMNNQLECIQNLAGECHEEWQEVLKACTPRIIVYILPLFAASKSGDVSADREIKKRLAIASKCYDRLVEALTNEVKDKIIHAHLDMIVVNVLMCLHCRDNAGPNWCVPDPNPPSYNSYIIRATLDYLTQSSGGGGKTLVSVLSKSGGSIQRVLLELSSTLSTEHRVSEKCRVLTMYRVFLDMLLPEFAGQLGGCWAFVLRDVLHRMVTVMKESDSSERVLFVSDGEMQIEMIESCLVMLHSLCSVALECCPQELAKYLDLIVSAITVLTKHREAVKEKCQTLLNLLILDNTGLLREAICLLDPFPQDDEYVPYNRVHTKLKTKSKTLSTFEMLGRTVEVLQDKQTITDSCLKTLQDLSLLSRAQLNKLIAKEGNEALSQMLCELLHLTQSSSHQVALYAASCLGVIGPVDLGGLSLPRKRPGSGLRESLEAYSEDPRCQSYCWIFHKLDEYLLDPCVSVVKTSGEVLRSMLATKTGVQFSADYKNRLDETDFLFSYLHPFKSKKATLCEKGGRNQERFYQAVNVEKLWTPSHSDHKRWIVDLTQALIRSDAVSDEILRLLGPICKIKAELCEIVLPLLIHDILASGVDGFWQVLSHRVAAFFHAHCLAVASKHTDKKNIICTNKDSLQIMLNVIQYLRKQNRPRKGPKALTPWDNNFWLDVNYLEIAKAALYSAAPFTAILYAEIWTLAQSEEDASSSVSSSLSQYSQDIHIDKLGSVSPPDLTVSLQELLLEAYQSVGDPDGVYGCGAGRLADPVSRIKTYLHEDKVEKAVVTYDIALKTGQTQELGLLKTFQEFGTDHLLELCLKGQHHQGHTLTPAMAEIQYEAAWRTGQWGLNVTSRCTEESGFHQSVYSAMDALKDNQLNLAKAHIETARKVVLRVVDTRPESCRSIYPVLSQLHGLFHLQCIVDAAESQVVIAEEEQDENCSFEFLHLGWNMKRSALKILAESHPDRRTVTERLGHLLHNMACSARSEGRYQVAERLLSELKQIDHGDMVSQLRVEMEEAKLYWARDEHNIAKHLIKSLIAKLENLHSEGSEAVELLPQALATYGSWLAETRTENPTIILDNYLEKTVELLQDSSDGDIVEAFMSLAQFVDSQYQNIVNYIKSSTFESKQALMRKAKQDAQSVREHLSQKDLHASSRYLKMMEKQTEIDEREVEALMEDRQTFLVKAVQTYIKCLKAGDKHDLRIYRLTSLWFDNPDCEDVNDLLDREIGDIKSHKFLPLMYQLAARMSARNNHCPLFQPNLTKILERAAVEHPHHAVWVIMALAHAYKDTELLTQAKGGRRSKLTRTVSDTDSQEEDRVQAAKNLIERLKNNGKVAETVRTMEKLSVAYIQLANTSADAYRKETKPIPLPATQMLSQMKNLTSVALPTLHMPVDPTGQYKDVVTIKGFADTFRLAGGINLPKIITIIGSDGIKRRQLVKGRDDLRQDAVMQQVFGMVNSLVKKNPETRKRQLSVRMYKVLPLSQRSGVLEWCEGTQPLGEYLIGSSSVKGAHPKYRPQDISAGECRKVFGGAHVDEKLKMYLKVCRKFQPVLRHFFMERFSEPAVWFERRLAYTRSVATNSIIGYILGLGDRHLMNILIDCNSAELVHIDLGIAFEQGKILPTPETVPFRLTRDIVDGMGVTGVEGVFRRCCEKMMEVMHGHQEALLMILQVLLYDPLNNWSLTPQQILQIQNKRGRADPDASELNTTTNENDIENVQRSGESQDSVNKMAERVLLRLQQKLQGIEDGLQLSVSGQVNKLIQEARDPNNLCRLFVGWQPYL